MPLDYGDPSLVGYWTFDEGAGAIAYDYSGNNATGSWSGTATGTSGYYSPGKIGSWSGAFDGSSTYISLPTMGLSNVTMSAWFQPQTIPGSYQTIVSLEGSVGYFRFDQLGSNIFLYWNDAGGNHDIGTYTITPGQWYYILASKNGNSLTYYINGAANTSNSINGVIGTSSFGNKIGARSTTGANYYFSGLIDDVRVYNRALSAAEIQALYNGGK
jgi:hypothetical protein